MDTNIRLAGVTFFHDSVTFFHSVFIRDSFLFSDRYL